MHKFICINLITETVLMNPYYKFDVMVHDYRKDLLSLYLNEELIFSTKLSLLDSSETFDNEQEAIDFTNPEEDD